MIVTIEKEFIETNKWLISTYLLMSPSCKYFILVISRNWLRSVLLFVMLFYFIYKYVIMFTKVME